MSKRINVNPDHYKVRGRERPSTLAANMPRPSLAVNRAEDQRRKKKVVSKKP